MNGNHRKLFLICVAAFMTSFPPLTFGQELETNKDFKLVTTEDYWEKIEPIGNELKVKLFKLLEGTPARVPSKAGRNIRNLWEHLNRRLRETGIEYEVIMESNIPPRLIREYYLDANVKEFDGDRYSGDKMEKVIAKMSCLDLMYLLVQNTHMQLFVRKHAIILLNLWDPKRLDTTGDPFEVMPKK